MGRNEDGEKSNAQIMTSFFFPAKDYDIYSKHNKELWIYFQ